MWESNGGNTFLMTEDGHLEDQFSVTAAEAGLLSRLFGHARDGGIRRKLTLAVNSQD